MAGVAVEAGAVGEEEVADDTEPGNR